MTHKGRNLERIVHAIERCFSPGEAEVNSPDRIPDRITGQLREVDVAIHYKLGSVPILVILECRDRNDIEDVTWIEQLATKRDDIRAARAAAVSTFGFTQPALIKAAHLGIEIRTIDELTLDNVRYWVGAEVMSSREYRADISAIRIFVTDTLDASDPPVRAEFERLFGNANVHDLVLFTKLGHVPTSPARLWARAVEKSGLIRQRAQRRFTSDSRVRTSFS